MARRCLFLAKRGGSMPEPIETAPPAAGLADAIFFRGLDGTPLAAALSLLDDLPFEPVESFFRKGDAGAEVYVILSGQVSIREPDAGGAAPRDVQLMHPSAVF